MSSVPLLISAPSGTGKSTLIQMLLAKHANQFELCISHTTRDKRPNEVDGKHYFFVSIEDFLDKQQNNGFIEWQRVHGNLYGTCIENLREISQRNRTPVLDIDVNGFQSLIENEFECFSVFIVPPSIHELKNRLESRNTDSEAVILSRLKKAKYEIEMASDYDFILINDDLEEAYLELCLAVTGNKNMDQEDKDKFIESLVSEFDSFYPTQAS